MFLVTVDRRQEVGDDVSLHDLSTVKKALRRFGYNCLTIYATSVPDKRLHIDLPRTARECLELYNPLVGENVVVAVPAQLGIEQVEVVVSHAECLQILAAEDNVLLVDPIQQQGRQILLR